MGRSGINLAIGVVLVATLTGCGSHESKGAAGPAAPAVTGVGVQTVQEAVLPELYVTVGTVRARTTAQVAARIAGTVSQVAVREGDRVSKGKLLVTIEAAEQTAGAAAARAAEDEARRGLEESRSRQRLADATYGRFQKLFQDQAVTRQELDNRQTELEVAAQGVARAEARLRQFQEGAKAAGVLVGYTRVTAPISGLVTGKAVEAGMTIFPGMPLVTIDGEGGYRLEAAVPESLVSHLAVGQLVAVTVDGGASAGTGRISEIVPAADPLTRTVTVKIDLAGKGLKSGQFGRASLPMATRKGLLVPKGAIIEQGSLTSVWVVGSDRIARLRLVKPGREQGATTEILSGLTAGESIVVSGIEKVADGARIQ